MTALEVFHEVVAGGTIFAAVFGLCCLLAGLAGDPDDDNGPTKPA